MNYNIYQYQHDSQILKTDLFETWLCRVRKGKAKVLFEQTKYDLETDTIFLVQEGAAFKVLSSTRDMTMEVLIFDEALMNVVYSLCGAEADFGKLEMMFWVDKMMEEPFCRIMAMDYDMLKTAILQPSLIARNKMIMANLVHLLLTLYNAAGGAAKPSQSDNSKRSRMLLNHFFELISTHTLSGERNIPFYAEKLCVSERYLFKVCKKETGKTPKDLINEFLIGQIKNALLTTEMTHQQISDQFGFPDQSAFGQFFKRQEGMSPSEFRQRYR